MLCTIVGNKKFDAMKIDKLYPKDLIRAHGNVTKQYKNKKNEILQRRFKELCAEKANMAYVDEETGFLIRCAESPAELTHEGAALSHCVGSYAKDVAEGRTTIFFIRKIEAPDVPFCTLEYARGRVVQNRGFENHDPPPEVKEFEGKWLEYLKTLNKKEKSKNGRKQNTADRVGA